MFKKILPVGIGIVLILAIALTITFVKKANNRTPDISDPDNVYVSYSNKGTSYQITNERLYTYMKNKYGTNELLDWVDKQLYPEYTSVDTSDEDFIKFVKNEVFETEDLSDPTDDEKESYQDTWDSLISSLRISNLISEADAADTDYTNETSKVWTVVKDYYRLSYAREQAAKKAIWADFLEGRETTEADPFKNYYLKSSDDTNSIEAYYEENYSDSAVVIAIPFNSEAAALAALNKVGINTDSNVIGSNNGWVYSSYDYYSKAEVEDTYKLTQQVVSSLFGVLYNIYVNSIFDGNSFEATVLDAQTAYKVNDYVQELYPSTNNYGVKLALPTTIKVNNSENDATIVWSLSDTTYATLNTDGNEVSSDFANGDEVDDTTKSVKVTLNYTITFGDATKTDSITVTLYGTTEDEGATYKTPEDYIESVNVEAVDAYQRYTLTQAFIDANKDALVYDEKTADAINTAFTTCILGDDATLTISEDPDKEYLAYTVEPVEIGDYYFLIYLDKTIDVTPLFSGDTSTQTNDDGDVVGETYTIANQDLFDEIVAAMKEKIINVENDIDKFIYKNRYDHGLTIYDAYCEAIYSYNYKYFFETTIAANDYDEYKTSKKTQKKTVCSVQTEAGNKKSAVKLTAQELFDSLEAKYATNAIAVLVQNYILVTDKDLNDVYNPYTDTVYDKTAYNNLINSEVKSLKQNFENGYFTYSYLSYYGFTPNFPAKYGWSKFIKDYFVAFNDQELLTVSTYGGTLYSNALAKYIDDNSLEAINEEMKKAYDEYFSVNVNNILVTLDTDYNADADGDNDSTNIMAEEKNWTPALKDAAAKLIQVILNLRSSVAEDSWYDQVSELTTLYTEALPSNESIDSVVARSENGTIDSTLFGPFVKLGLHVKVESAADYTSSSSIAEEFADKCAEMYDYIEENDKLDVTLDAPVYSEAFSTCYGVHVIALNKATKKTELPSAVEIAVYRAQTLVDDTQDDIDDIDENIASYEENGYSTASYEAQRAYSVQLLEKYKAALAKVLSDNGLASDYTLDDEATERITAWYTSAESTVEGGTLVTEKLTTKMLNEITGFTFKGDVTTDQFKDYLNLVLAQCAEENED